MGAVGGLLGLSGGSGGTGFGINPGVAGSQINNAYTGVQNSLGNQNALLTALQGQQGLANQSNVYNQLQQIAAGQGPNPAQTMLAQATGQNVANQAALMAGQRGAAQNVGLLARQAAQEGANLQQQAAGQGATMQAQQSLNALGAAGNLANTMAGQQIGQTNQNAQTQMGEQQNLLGANSQANAIQGQLANTQMGGQQSLIGGFGNAAGSALSLGAGLFADGGVVPGASVVPVSNMPQSNFAQFLTGAAPMPKISSDNSGAQALNKGVTAIGKGIQQRISYNGDMNALDEMAQAGVFNSGGNVGGKLKAGGHVPGQAKVKGDSLKNDTVSAKLSPGEIVIPRSVVQSKDPVRGSAQFVAQILAKKQARGGK